MPTKNSTNPFYGRPSASKQAKRDRMFRSQIESYATLRQIRKDIAPQLQAINAAEMKSQNLE
jgi:hypothetical protein